MNRNGSLVQDAKGRDREPYSLVYGARVKVRERQAGNPNRLNGPGGRRGGPRYLVNSSAPCLLVMSARSPLVQ